MGKESKVVGVTKVHDKWRAIVEHKKQRYHLGYFDLIEEAIDARMAKLRELNIEDGVMDIDGETWLVSPSLGYPYYVSNKGRVKTVNYRRTGCERLLKLAIRECSGREYYMINTTNYGNHSVHRLVMEAFVGPSDLQVNHIDNNPLNNYFENLEYVTNRENTSHWKGGSKGCIYTMGAWRAGIRINGRHVNLGRHETFEQAHARYLQALDDFGIKDKYTQK